MEPPGSPETVVQTEGRPLLEWVAIGQGTLVALAVLAAVAVVASVADRAHMSDSSRNQIDPFLLLGLFSGYFVAGWLAGRRAWRAPLTNGALAALGAIALWLPIRVGIWIVRPEGHGLLHGAHPVLTSSSVYAQVLIATTFGMVGGWLGSRRARYEAARREPALTADAADALDSARD